MRSTARTTSNSVAPSSVAAGSAIGIYLVVFFQQLIASTTHLVGQDVTAAVDPRLVLIFRSSIASIILALILVWKYKSFRLFRGIPRQDVWRIVLIGMFNVPINQLLYLEGLRFTTAANSALLYAMTPAMVFVFTLGTRMERLSFKKGAGILLAFIGVAILMFERGATLESAHTKGNFLIFIAVIAWSLYTMLGKSVVAKYGALRVTALNMIVGTLLYLPFGLLLTDLMPAAQFTGVIWSELLYLGFFASVVNYLLWFFALEKLETSKLAIFQNLQPVLTTILALMLGKLILTGQLVGGGIMALIGVVLVQFG